MRTLTHPMCIAALRRAQRAGCKITTVRSAVRYCLTHAEAWDQPVQLSDRRPPRRPVLTDEEREDRRAAADPAFRRRLLGRLRRQATMIRRMPLGGAAAYHALGRRVARIASRAAALPPLRMAVQELAGSRCDRYDLARRLGVQTAARRGEDWDVVATADSSYCVEEAGQIDFRAGDPAGAAIRAGYRVVYTRATYETHVRSIAWIMDDGTARLLLHDRLYTLPAANEWSVGERGLLLDGRDCAVPALLAMACGLEVVR